jgi:hypothetical protein
MAAEEDSTEEKSEDQRREELYQATRTELLAKQFSNSEAYDKAVLTLSSAFLGVSLAFIKDAAQGEPLAYPWLLVVSWAAFALAIVAAVVSFQTGNIAIDVQLVRAERYYKQKDETAYPKTSFARFNEFVNWASGILFVIGVILTIVFVSANLMEKNSVSKISKTGPTQAFFDSQKISNMQKVETFQKSHTITDMQKITPSPAPVPTTQPGQSTTGASAPVAQPAKPK